MLSAISAESSPGPAGFPDVDKAADFELPDQDGVGWHLADHLEQGPVLLVFYRGDW